ncbi:MAG: hydrogenase formation protein HypD [Candidatus Saccharicenans sp.]
MVLEKSKKLPSSGWRSKGTVEKLLESIALETDYLNRPIKLMEVCGTHTMTLHRYGLKPQLEEVGVEMISGPGCPVCITPDYYHEAIINLLAEKNNIIVCTFGDMTRVPTRKGSLQTFVPKEGSKIKIVYSPEEALEIARENPEKEVIFFGAGFETTIPAITFTVKRAYQEKLKNYSILAAFWLIPPALEALINSKELAISGFIYPGHVSAIIGEQPYAFVARKYGLPGAIAGFEPTDILLGVLSVAGQLRRKKPEVDNVYRRVVRAEGNPEALSLMDEMLEKADVDWRGLGIIPKSGLKLKSAYSQFDATRRYGLKLAPVKIIASGCRCGDVIKGLITPRDCPLFGRSCRPDSPKGPCMVSYEGACLIEFKYSSGVAK